MKFRFGKKFRHGSVSLAITAGVIAAVILLNAAVSALFSLRLLFWDMTSEKMYRVSQQSVDYLRKTLDEVNEKRRSEGEEDVLVDIIFCADPDMLKSNDKMRYIYYTALTLEKKFQDTIRVTEVDVWSNPSSVDAYRTNSYSSIYQSNIIISSGSEFRVTDIKTYYTYNDITTGEEPWAINVEKKFLQFIMAVTKAEAPICGITVNHGEPFATEEGKAEYSELLNVIDAAGYEIQFLNLEEQAIPENCRLILTFDPQTDFKTTFNSSSTVSEIAMLDDFLDKAYSFMVFVDADTPVLTNLEEFLLEWGITLDRQKNPDDKNEILGNYQINSDSSIDSEGLSVIGAYETEALGGAITENMRENASPKVVFGNAISVSYSPAYTQTFVLADAEAGTGAYSYGAYSRNFHSRAMYDVFRSGKDSKAYSVMNGEVAKDDAGNPIAVDTQGNYKLMTITRETRIISEGKGYTTVNDASYVCAVGSTEFASNKILGSNAYGNTDVLLETLRTVGKEVVPVGILFKPIYDGEMTAESSSTGEVYYTETGNTVWTVVLVLIPLVAALTCGLVILVKRKARHG